MLPKPFLPWTAPAGTAPSSTPVIFGSMPTAIQWTKPLVDRSVTTSARLVASAGTPDHDSAGEVPPAGEPLGFWQVYRGSMIPSSSHGARSVMPASPTPSPGSPDPSTAGSAGTLVVVLLTRVAV